MHAALDALWRAADARAGGSGGEEDEEAVAEATCVEAERRAAGLDRNSAQLLRHLAAQMRADDGAAVEELALALVPNPENHVTGPELDEEVIRAQSAARRSLRHWKRIRVYV